MSETVADRVWTQIRLADYALDDDKLSRARAHLSAALPLGASLNPAVNQSFYASEWLARVVRLAEMQNARRDEDETLAASRRLYAMAAHERKLGATGHEHHWHRANALTSQATQTLRDAAITLKFLAAPFRKNVIRTGTS